ncbi:hypothetical protein GOP47_0016482 [Adiantum capillus-veneris]|uniref:Uncharacterized protein n=1 Tax=Adiantum capillus-veneris TaxID=13818 RepID=A0A9D4ZBS4_ADICA|nr:hypothetical protein GOP47_0016482 [Adiantum capillus-veneris]
MSCARVKVALLSQLEAVAAESINTELLRSACGETAVWSSKNNVYKLTSAIEFGCNRIHRRCYLVNSRNLVKSRSRSELTLLSWVAAQFTATLPRGASLLSDTSCGGSTFQLRCATVQFGGGVAWNLHGRLNLPACARPKRSVGLPPAPMKARKENLQRLKRYLLFAKTCTHTTLHYSLDDGVADVPSACQRAWALPPLRCPSPSPSCGSRCHQRQHVGPCTRSSSLVPCSSSLNLR